MQFAAKLCQPRGRRKVEGGGTTAQELKTNPHMENYII